MPRNSACTGAVHSTTNLCTFPHAWRVNVQRQRSHVAVKRDSMSRVTCRRHRMLPHLPQPRPGALVQISLVTNTDQPTAEQPRPNPPPPTPAGVEANDNKAIQVAKQQQQKEPVCQRRRSTRRNTHGQTTDTHTDAQLH
uniref:(northern house mosquito) hypothetical protein n=1 Tax=Culex pipiens TaxID=7175 RepID=A0A8D8CLG4_CULPI